MASYASPLFRTTTASLNPGETLEVDVRVNGRPLSYVAVKPSTQPDTGSPHTVGVNLASPVFDLEELATWEFEFPSDVPADLRAHSVHVTSQKTATTFLIVGHV